ncbi:uncharacterized protein SRS1_14001 [Sporisorium reilianum f. sp. reilianum]|uniref:J domain-containing protein n=1 Tax=Sporisorium reilianum f. sp. reilianum TaxID=72559 RepID=A0A2N8UDX1_9BASI|nr:uncharacterized protein SRS1_14001 [Sporisorium reilianum f. sp. reilianum]
MPPPARATVEEIGDEDDPYAPYRPAQRGSRTSRTSSAGPSASSSGASSSSTSTSTASSTSSHTSASTSSAASASRTPPAPPSYGQNSTASDIYDQSPSAGTQGTFPREGGDEEPLFGGRPFRDAHDPASGSDRATDKEYLYAILNVPTDATPDAIKDAYRSLAVVLHPDKHKEASRKSAAESRFREVQRAYEILSDAEKRAIYDYFGEEGLKSTWSVAVRGRSPREMQEEFERERRRKQAVDAEVLVKSKGDFTAHVDASALFAHPSRLARRPPPPSPQQPAPAGSVPGGMIAPVASFPRAITLADRIARINCTQLIGKHGFETQVTNQTSATFSGQMVSRNGLGGGNLVGTVKTHWSPRLFTEITLSFLRPQIVTTKGQYTVDANSFFTWQATQQTLMLPPTLNLTYGQRLSAKSTLTGFTSVRSGTYTLGAWGRDVGTLVRREPAAVSVGLTKHTDAHTSWTAQTSISPIDQNLSLDYAFPLLAVKLRTGFNIGTGSGLSAYTSAERRLTENVRVSLGLTCALPVGGVTLRIKVNRLGQKMLLPVLLSPDMRADLVVAFTVLPAAAYGALYWGWLEPSKRKRLRDRVGELRRANAQLIAERRQAAVEAIEVLRDPAAKKARVEIERRGLVVLEAWYGRKTDLPPPLSLPASALDDEAQRIWSTLPTPADAEGAWDVKIPLQALIQRAQLIVPAGRSKAHLLGFHDPAMGEQKHLSVTYAFRGALHHVVVADADELALPMRLHQVG